MSPNSYHSLGPDWHLDTAFAETQLLPQWQPAPDDAGSWSLVIIGRLKPGVTATQAGAGMSLLVEKETIAGTARLLRPGEGQAITLSPVPDALRDSQKGSMTPLYLLIYLWRLYWTGAWNEITSNHGLTSAK